MISLLKNIIAGQVHGYGLSKEIKRKTDELYWSAVFNSAIKDSGWFKKQNLNPGRWAAGYPLLYVLFRVYNDIKPKSVLEFGLGETSKLAYQYIAANPAAKLTIVEQDVNWLDFFSNTIHDVVPNTILLDLELKTVEGFETKVYKGLIEKTKGQKFDLVIVDGPYGSDHFSRYQIVDMIENELISDDFVIIMDDYERNGEKETVSKIRERLLTKNKDFVEGNYSGAKDSLLLCSKSYKFLTSL